MTDSDRLTPPVGEPVRGSPPHDTDVLGLRIVAAQVDLTIRTVLFEAREGPVETTVAGLPALRYDGDEVVDGTRVEVTRVQAFGSTAEYIFNCRHTRAQAADIEQGCAQILNTFAVESASEHEPTRA